MNNLLNMVWVEMIKAIRSRMPLWTAVGSLFFPFGIGFLIFVARNPEISKKLGLISMKADLVKYSATDWPAYINLISLIIAAGGMFLFCLVISWVFGREFADGTLKDLLAVPVKRYSIVIAKFIIVAIWSVLLTFTIIIAGVTMGAVIGLPDGSPDVILRGCLSVLTTGLMVISIILPFAFLASAGRGYLLPISGAILAVMAANVVSLVGWGEYFPWAIPGLFTMQESRLPPISYWIVLFTGLVGIIITMLWWNYADQNN